MHHHIRQRLVKAGKNMPSLAKWQELFKETRSLTYQYPSFVTSRRPDPLTGREIPVFTFHTITAPVFEAQLAFLADNGYRAAGLDEFYRFLEDDRPAPPGTIMLTFDDVERSLLTTGVPLLRKYGFRCVAFVAAGRILEQHTEKTATGARVWPTWLDVREMVSSGIVDIGSHTLNHAAIFTGDRLIDFVHPGIFVAGLGLDNPLVRQDGRDVFLTEYGAPVFAMASRMTEQPRYFDDEHARARCVRFVDENGGAEFFNNRDWRRRLCQFYRSVPSRQDSAKRWETPEEQRTAIRRELTESRRVLEERTGCRVLDFAYPWAAGSDLAVELSREAGYRTNFWGPLPRVRINMPGQDPWHVARIKEDYIFRLPGKGRKTFREILQFKIRRRREHTNIY